MRGSSSASEFSSSRKTSRAIRPARRVGRYSVASASLSECVRASKPSTSLPSTSAAITVRRKGAESGTLKTRMGFLIRGQVASWHGRIAGAISNWREKPWPPSDHAGEECLLGRAYGVRGSHVHPHAVHPQPKQPLLVGGAV